MGTVRCRWVFGLPYATAPPTPVALLATVRHLRRTTVVTGLWRCCDGVVTAASLLSAHSGDPLRPPKAPATVREIHGRMPERYAASMPRPIPSAGVRPPTDRPCYSGTDHPTSRTTGSPEDRFMAVLACPLCLLYSRQCPPNRGIRKVLKTHGNPIPISRSYGAGRIRN